MTKHPEADKEVILNARITWAFSVAYRYTKKPEYLTLATCAYKHIRTFL